MSVGAVFDGTGAGDFEHTVEGLPQFPASHAGIQVDRYRVSKFTVSSEVEAENIGEMHSIYGVQRMQQRLGGEAAERLDRSVAKEGLFALEIDRRVVHEAVIRDVGEEIASLLLEGEERLQGLQRMHGLRGFLGLFGVGGLDGVEEFHRFARCIGLIG